MMKPMKNSITLFFLLISGSLLLLACAVTNSVPPQSTEATDAITQPMGGVAGAAATTPQWPCLNPPTLADTIPGDTPLSDQASLNCFAWQEFIGLNWPTGTEKTAADFGEPNDYAPVVFETYKTNHDLFDYQGDKPPKWSDPTDSVNVGDGAVLHTLKRTSKFSVDFENADIEEAFPFKPAGHAWLADKQGNLVWYEVLMNQPEYDYFYENEFYQAANQYRVASQGKHIDLPKGDLSGNIGAIELKAAWLTVTDPSNPKWTHYKLAQAEFCSATGCTPSTVALIGLHIIHKTAAQPSWIWATFEHVDNAPDRAQVNNGPIAETYNFYSNTCQESAIPAACVDGKADQKTSCVANTPPAYALQLVDGRATGLCQPYPIQVVREYPIPDTHENPVQSINQAAQSLIRSANPDSVYQYYQLVNVLWNDSAVDENKAHALPLNALSKTAFRPNPNAFPVANTTMETYIQQTTCIACHSGAQIANPEQAMPAYASDYSFIFGMAK